MEEQVSATYVYSQRLSYNRWEGTIFQQIRHQKTFPFWVWGRVGWYSPEISWCCYRGRKEAGGGWAEVDKSFEVASSCVTQEASVWGEVGKTRGTALPTVPTCPEVHVCPSPGQVNPRTRGWAQLACPKAAQETTPLEKPGVASRVPLCLSPADALETDTGLPVGLITQKGSWQGEPSLGQRLMTPLSSRAIVPRGPRSGMQI